MNIHVDLWICGDLLQEFNQGTFSEYDAGGVPIEHSCGCGKKVSASLHSTRVPRLDCQSFSFDMSTAGEGVNLARDRHERV